MLQIFLSSVQNEFAEERKMIADLIENDPIFKRFFSIYTFECEAAQDRKPEKAYLKAVEESDVYIGLFGKQYDSKGIITTPSDSKKENYISPTKKEYLKATKLNKYKIIFIKQLNDKERDYRETAFIKEVQEQVIRKKFDTIDSLNMLLRDALSQFMVDKGTLNRTSFEESYSANATLADLDTEKIKQFIRTARSSRGYKYPEETDPSVILMSLNLPVKDGRVPNGAVLLFGKEPQSFFISSEVKCVQYTGNVVAKPVPTYQIFQGTIFEMIEQADAFVLGHIDNAVGERNKTKTASVDTDFELPAKAVREAIVNALCHRDYYSQGSVQVELYRNRLEIKNPGHLPKELTIKSLKEGHLSVPANPQIANVLYLNLYVEKVGSGTNDIINECAKKHLKEPSFFQEGDVFKTVIYRKTTIPVAVQVPEIKVESLVTPGHVQGELSGQLSGQLTGQLTGELIGKLTGGLKGNIRGRRNSNTLTKIQISLNDNQRQTLSFIIDNEGCNSKLISDTLGKPLSTVYKHLDVLTNMHIVERKGSKKTGGYYLLRGKKSYRGNK